MPAVKDAEVRTTVEEEERDELAAARDAGEIRFGEDSKFVQVSINVSFPFSSIVIPAGRRMGGGFFEFARKAIPTRSAPDEKEAKEAPQHRRAGRPAA